MVLFGFKYASWDTLLQDEGLTGWADALLPQMRCTALADAMLRLRALQQGRSLEGAQCRTVGVRIDVRGASCTRTLQLRTGDGEQTLHVDVDVGSDDRVRRMEFRE
jgi:hypothetical protein